MKPTDADRERAESLKWQLGVGEAEDSAAIAKALADARAEGIEMAIKVVESGVFLHMDSPMAKEAKSLVAALRNLLVE